MTLLKLRQVADKIETGTISLEQKGEEVVLNLPDSVELKIEAKSKMKKFSTKKQIEFEIEWKENASDDATIDIK